MISENWAALELLFAVCGAVFGLVAAVFHWRAAAPKDKQEKARNWYAERWATIEASPWLTMPERVVRWLLQAKSRFLSAKQLLWSDMLINMLPIICACIPIAFGLGAGLLAGVTAGIIGLVFGLFPAGFVLLGYSLGIHDDNPSGSALIRAIFWTAGAVLALPLCLLASVVWTILVLRLPVLLAPIVMIGLSPVFWAGISTGTGVLIAAWKGGVTDRKPKSNRRNSNSSDKTEMLSSLVALSYSASLLITVSAFAVGRVADPHAWIPQTPQMIISNLIFDTLTVLTTIAILGWAVRKEGPLRIPVAILFDILVAAILACLSLFCGLMGTEHVLSLRETLNILAARSVDTEHWELGPYFWVMHTTFLPTLAYLFFIFVCWLGKMMLVSVRFLFGEAKAAENPLLYTARLCTILMFLFSVLTAGAALMESRSAAVKELPAKPHAYLVNTW